MRSAAAGLTLVVAKRNDVVELPKDHPLHPCSARMGGPDAGLTEFLACFLQGREEVWAKLCRQNLLRGMWEKFQRRTGSSVTWEGGSLQVVLEIATFWHDFVSDNEELRGTDLRAHVGSEAHLATCVLEVLSDRLGRTAAEEFPLLVGKILVLEPPSLWDDAVAFAQLETSLSEGDAPSFMGVFMTLFGLVSGDRIPLQVQGDIVRAALDDYFKDSAEDLALLMMETAGKLPTSVAYDIVCSGGKGLQRRILLASSGYDWWSCLHESALAEVLRAERLQKNDAPAKEPVQHVVVIGHNLYGKAAAEMLQSKRPDLVAEPAGSPAQLFKGRLSTRGRSRSRSPSRSRADSAAS